MDTEISVRGACGPGQGEGTVDGRPGRVRRRPARAAREADAPASEVADAVVAGIEARRAELGAFWGGETAKADTDSLRLVLREYRSYTERLAGDRPGTERPGWA